MENIGDVNIILKKGTLKMCDRKKKQKQRCTV